jgi:exopolysaccharide biosynthesis polyprenyl glycosylphosphotransferase
MNRKKQMLQYVVADLAMAVVVWVLFFVFRRYANDSRLFPDVVIWSPNYSFWTMLFIYPTYCLLIHYLSGYYLRPFRKQFLVEFVTTFITSLLIALTIFFVLVLGDKVVSYHYYYVSFSVLFALQFGFTFLARLMITRHMAKKIKTGQLSFNTLIIGTGSNALTLFGQLQVSQYKEGNKVVGFVEVNDEAMVDKEKVLCSLPKIASVIQQHHIVELFIAVDNADENTLFSIINSLLIFPVTIKILPRTYEFLTARVKINQFLTSPHIEITALSMADWQLCVKRFFDITVSAFVLVFFSPVFLYLFIRVKRDAPGAAFYRQERIGLHGKPFQIIKFRTMYHNAENGVPQLTTAQDQRITPFGMVMRRYRLDELPQFYNILKGEMSIVGPRPERKYFIQQIIEIAPYYCLLYNVRPGLTSWGPIKVGYTDTREKMVKRLQYDILYLENMSLLSDLQILFFTLSIIIRGKGL